MEIFLIGAGKVATAIANNISLCGFYARDKFKAEQFAKKTGVKYYEDLSSLPHADIYIVSVNDDSISSITTLLADFIDTNATIAHTSGTIPLNSINNKFKNRAVLYPLFPFAQDMYINLREVTFFTEYSSTKSNEIISLLLKDNSLNSIEADSFNRKQVHLAAVFASNFTNHIFSISQKILQNNGYSFDILQPLINQLFKNISIKNIDIKTLQTGPAYRADQKVISEHLELLNSNEDYKNIYNILTESIKNNK